MCECGRRFETTDVNAGRRAQCPSCGRQFYIPAPRRPEILYIPGPPPVIGFSGKAFLSLVFGVLFVLACLTGIPAILIGQSALRDINESGGQLRGRWLARIGIFLGVIGCVFTLVILSLPAVSHSGEAPRRVQCVNNLKQIGLALHNYNATYNCFPLAAITDQKGKPLLSWRVAILPQMEYSELYSQFHLNEAWDSPHNLSLVEKMPQGYRCPSDPDPKPGWTGYQGFIGAKAAFAPDFSPLGIADFTDGTSNTIMVGETQRVVPWTKPDDIPSEAAGFPGALHSHHPGGFNTLFVDGSVKFIKYTTKPNVLEKLITRNGGEIINTDSY